MDNELKEKLKKIKAIFDVGKISSLNIDQTYIQKYYSVNKIPYSIFHGKTNLVHMGISRDDVFKEDDLFAQPETIEKYIHKANAKKVLELATGRGANSLWLADRNKDKSFYGIDISKMQLSFAISNAEKTSNYHPSIGDYHDLKQFKDGFFDIVFVIESLCHSTNKDRVFSEVFRVLKQGGHFIIFDGYTNKKPEELNEDEQLATQLLGRCMAVENFNYYHDLKGKMIFSKFIVEYEENLSQHIIPTLEKFEKSASKFFKHPVLAKMFSKILPNKFIYNSISGYLFPTLMRLKISSYWLTVLRK